MIMTALIAARLNMNVPRAGNDHARADVRTGSESRAARRSWPRPTWLLVALAFLMMPVASFAQAPRTISWQGVLTDDLGTPVPDGSYDLTLRVYDVSSGGTALHTEAYPATPVIGGHFTVTLGSLVPLTMPFDASHWLGVQVGTDPEILPRTRLTASPYALSLAMPYIGRKDGPEPAFWIENHDATGKALALDGLLIVERDSPRLNPFLLMGVFSTLDTELGLRVRRPDTHYYPVAGLYGLTGYSGVDVSGPDGQFVGVRTYGIGPDDPSVLVREGGNEFELTTTTASLPANSISAAEVADEAGASSSAQSILPTSVHVTPTVLLSTMMDCPAPGFVLVLASFEAVASHSNGTASRAAFGISTNPSALPYWRDEDVMLPASFPTGTVKVPVSVQSVLPVAAGTQTFHLLGQESSGSFSIEDGQLTAVFLPTAYGAVPGAPLAGAADAREVTP